MLRAAADVPPAFKKSRRFQNELSLSKGFVLSRAAKSQFVKAYASCRWSSFAPLHPGSQMRTATKESGHSSCATDKEYRMPLTAMSRALKRPEPIRFSPSPCDCAGHKISFGQLGASRRWNRPVREVPFGEHYASKLCIRMRTAAFATLTPIAGNVKGAVFGGLVVPG
jgi:hypothetical protein